MENKYFLNDGIILSNIDDEYIRECSECGSTISNGYMVDDGSWYCCEHCMNAMLVLGLMRESDGENELGGFYDELVDNVWEPTGVFWTDWRD